MSSAMDAATAGRVSTISIDVVDTEDPGCVSRVDAGIGEEDVEALPHRLEVIHDIWWIAEDRVTVIRAVAVPVSIGLPIRTEVEATIIRIAKDSIRTGEIFSVRMNRFTEGSSPPGAAIALSEFELVTHQLSDGTCPLIPDRG